MREQYQKVPDVVIRSWIYACVMVIMIGLLSGCGRASKNQGTSNQGTMSSAAGCRAIPKLTKFTLQRRSSALLSHLHFSFPSYIQVTNEAKVRHVASALCNLPSQKPGTYHCPSSGPSVVYTLRFYVRLHEFAPITLHTGGCRQITGIGSQPRIATDEVWHTLGQAIDILNPRYKTFAGI